MTRVSVIIPTYNREDLLAETIRSVLSQTVQELEVIVADDGSTDGTAALVRQFGDSVRYVHQPNANHEGATRNLGIRASAGEYIACLDSDDLWEPAKLERQLALLDAHPTYGMVYSDAYAFESESRKRRYRFHQLVTPGSGWIAHSLYMHDYIPCPTPLIRRSVLEGVGLFSERPGLRMRSDWEMWLRIAARFQVGYDPEPLAGYRLHGLNSSSGEDHWTTHHSCLQVVQEALRSAPEVYASAFPQALAARYSHTASAFLLDGNVAVARALYAQAMRHNPRDARRAAFFAATLVAGPASVVLARAYVRRAEG